MAFSLRGRCACRVTLVKYGNFDDTVVADRDEVVWLAGLSVIDYERERSDAAKRLGIRAPVLDQLVKHERGDRDKDASGGAFALDDPDPWPEPVDGCKLLDALVETISRHMVLPAGAAEAIALWIVHAHAHDTAAISPILAVTSPTPECGKTTLLTLLGALVPKPLPASNITAAALFRAVEKWRPTVLVDEADTFLRDSDELRGVLNSGHNRSTAFVIRTVGKDHEPRQFHTWAPTGIALIGKLPATLESRAVHVELRRIAPGERVAPVRGDRLDHLEPLRQQIWRWAQDHTISLRSADPEMPPDLRGRAADNWRHLLAIAELAGGDWPQRAREAATTLSAGRDEQTAGIILLADIRDLFSARRTDRLLSTEIVEALTEMEHRPWPEWKGGKPITQRQLSKLLEPFEIGPKQIWTGSKNLRGYELEQFNDAFARYLGSQSARPLEPLEIKGCSNFQSARADEVLADRDAPKPLKTGHSSGLADKNPESLNEGMVCAHCGGADTPDDPILEAYDAGEPVRLHRGCMAAWAAGVFAT